MISVTRNSHMPSVDDSRCCSMFAKRCCSECCATTSVLLGNGNLLRQLVVVVGLPSDDGSLLEVVRRRRRSSSPLQSGSLPWVVSGYLAIPQRPEQINQWQQIAESQDGSSSGGEHVEHLELRCIRVIAPRHAHISENKLGKECQIESGEDESRGDSPPRFRIHAASDLRPPEMNSRQVRHHCAAHHDEVEVRDDKVGIRDVDIDAERRQEQAGHTTHREQTDEAERVKHWGVQIDAALIHRRGPVEDLDCRWYRDEVAEDRKHQRRIHRNSRDEHVVRPNKESEDSDADGGESYKVVTEDALARKTGYDFRHHCHARQDHDVHGGMRVEPEQVLEQHRIPAYFRIENPYVEEAFESNQREGDRKNRSSQHLDNGSRVMTPAEQPQARPTQAGSTHTV